jgi:tRNA-Thr(GGU) m(6)t(6)A37 methyltransferase TsaA
MKEIKYKPIGIVHSPFKKTDNAPRQPAYGRGIEATVEIFPEYEEGLIDIEKYSHIVLICHFHKSNTKPLKVRPPMEDKLRGVFASRSPNRPNPIGLSIVRLDRVEGRILYIRDVDIIDDTPVLDIKPYIPL